jgi:hypothetical protein
MRSEQLVNSVGCKIIWHFPAIAYLVFSEGGIGKMSSPAFHYDRQKTAEFVLRGQRLDQTVYKQMPLERIKRR